MPILPKDITDGDKYGPAMTIKTQTEADEYFEALVQHSMSFGHTRAEAEEIERSNLGYIAGYYSHDTRARVEQLFKCEHPFLGSIAERGAPTPERAFATGMVLGRLLKLKREAGKCPETEQRD